MSWLLQVMSLEEVTGVMHTLDLDGDGKLSLKEFTGWWNENETAVRNRTSHLSSTDISIIRTKCMVREMERIYKVQASALLLTNSEQ